MSTRCNIAIKLKSQDINRRLVRGEYSIVPHKPYLQVYCHNSGYPEGVGSDLLYNIDNYDDALNFIFEGHRSTFETSYINERNEPWKDDHPINYDNPKCENDYLYVFKNNKWYFQEYGENGLHLLSNYLNEGFFNPYDEADDISEKIDGISKEHKPDIYIKPSEKNLIKGVKLWDSKRKNNVYVKDEKVYSSRLFVKDDIVEECPVKLISPDALYHQDTRALAFEIDPEKRLYGIPAGLANYYRNSEDSGLIGNVDYEYNPDEGLIRIYAIKKIYPGDELIFKVEDENNFVNEYKKYQFKY